MAEFEDLAPLTYFGKWEESLSAVGWLEATVGFARGAVSEIFFEKLVRLCVNPWQPATAAGHHPCSMCRFTGGPPSISLGGMTVQLGVSNLFVPSKSTIFVAPTLIVHYIDAHEYQPPEVFQQAVLDCPDMRSMAYLKLIKARGLALS
jgi:hypothetical protein